MTTDARRIKWLLGSLNECPNLSEWESETFLPSVTEQFERKGTLSEKQVDTLERIYKEGDQ